jgi:hypothetical protein
MQPNGYTCCNHKKNTQMNQHETQIQKTSKAGLQQILRNTLTYCAIKKAGK